MARRLLSLAIVFPAAVLGTAPAWGQQIDYGRYEELFGEPVTMSATGKPERVSDTAVIMDVITADDIERSGARDIPTLLRRLAGVDVIHSSSGSTEVAIRGYAQPLGSRVMVLLNGRQAYFDGFGEDFWSTLPVELDEIRQIEVIKGPQSALYGFNAVDGVINIVTFDPVEDDVNVARTRIGNHARREFSATTTQSLGEGAGIRVTVADDHAQDYGIVDKSPANTQYAEDPNRRMASVNAGFDTADGSRIDVEASHSDVTMRWVALYPFFDTRIKTDAVKGSYTTDTSLGRINGTAYYTSIDMPWVNSQTFGPFAIGDRMAVAQLSDLFKLGPDDSFRLGGEGRHTEMGAQSLTGNGLLSGDLAAGSAMWEHSFSPALSAVNAVRYDHFQLNRSGPMVAGDPFTNADYDRALAGISVNSSLIAKVSGDDTLRLSFARGLKLPSLDSFGQVENFLAQYGLQYGGFYYYGSPDLAASAVYDYQAGWEHQLRSLDATARVNVFHEMTMKHISSPYGLVNGGLSLVSDMSTGSVADGVEVELRHRAKQGLDWGANYTFERLHEHADWGYADAEPAHKANVSLGYGFDRWDVELFGSYTSATKGIAIWPGLPPTASVVSIKDYTTLSPRVAWRPTDRVMIEAVAENLWPYQDLVPQRMETSYYLSVRVAY